MTLWEEGVLQSFPFAESEPQVLETMTSLAHQLGFDYCAYGLRMPIPLSNPPVAMLCNYPVAWAEQYTARNYLAIDPTVRQAMKSTSAFVWSEETFSSERVFWEEARSFGLREGLASVCRDTGGVSGMLSLVRSGEAITEIEWQAISARVLQLTEAVHWAFRGFVTPRLCPELNAKLSPREADILRWSGDGKTAQQVAEVLRISERTVNFHLRNAMAKLNAANKTEATLRAAVLGLL